MLSYVLVTPARNEERFIERTLVSVVDQTTHPLRWVIVDDGSTDGTAAVVERFAAQHPWIELVKIPVKQQRNFASKVHAFNAGYARVQGIEYDVIGNVDADISFPPDYVAFLLGCFEADADLGVAGTAFIEDGYDSTRDSFEGHSHVPGGCQLFRRDCFEEIGGYRPHRGGGVDWIAVTTARMKGWKTRAFRQKSFFHHRPQGTAERGAVSAMFFVGERDYFLGKHPLSEMVRVLYRLTKPPFAVGSLALMLGYAWALVRRKKRPITAELVQFRRREDMTKFSRMIGSVLRGKKVDKFYLLD
jgi:glycosyltransferase involved in cell wall biosynthesis